MEFLKRTFVKINGFWAGKLRMSSIVKALEWIRGDGSYRVREEHVPSCGGEWPICTNTELITDSINNLWPQIALHGEHEFDRIRDILLEQSVVNGLRLIPPTWRQALAQIGYVV
jgi:hypothetical protein